jgi:hypothetical protein
VAGRADCAPPLIANVRRNRLHPGLFEEQKTHMATVLLRIKVKPKAQHSELKQLPDGTWLATLKSPPVDGKANQELIALVARHFRCHKAAVAIKSGASGRTKAVKVTTK